MRTKMLIGFLSLLGLAFAVPANAVTVKTTLIPGGADYVLYGKQAIKMEQGGKMEINGNVAVNDVGGFLLIGAGNTINGTATADTMSFGTGAHVTKCEYNTVVGGDPTAVCGTIVTPLPAGTFPLAVWPTDIPILIPPVVNVTNNNQKCTAGLLDLPQGDYGTLVIADGCVLNLTTPNGIYNFKSIRLGHLSVTNGNGAQVYVTGQIITEAGTTINDVTMTSVATGTHEAIQIGNNSTLDGAILYAPFARMHLHQGGVYSNFEGVAVLITVEPIVITGIPATGCACIGKIASVAGSGTIQLTEGCHLDNPNNKFFVVLDCLISCPLIGAPVGCIPAVPSLQTELTATLTVPTGIIPYHVIVTSPSGQFCTAGTATP